MRKPIVSYPRTDVTASVYTHDINRDATNFRYYSSGKFLVGDVGIKYSHRPSPLLRYSLDVGMLSSFCKEEFAKIDIAGNIRWRNSKRSVIEVRGWAGHFLNNKYIPRQYRNYLSGGVDPNFDQELIFNRQNLEDNNFPPVFESQFIEDGASIRGLAMDGNRAIYSNETSFALNLTQSFLGMPLGFFADFAGATDLDGNFIDAGVLINMQVFKLFIPLYQSWDDESIINNFDWLKERFRFEIDIPLPSIG